MGQLCNFILRSIRRPTPVLTPSCSPQRKRAVSDVHNRSEKFGLACIAATEFVYLALAFAFAFPFAFLLGLGLCISTPFSYLLKS
jgi:hypothetical protein